MFANFCIPRLSNNMKIAVEKNHLGCHILYRSPNRAKKRRQYGHYLTQKIYTTYVIRQS